MMTHNFALSEEQTMILNTVRKFAEEQLAPEAIDLDEHSRFVRSSFEGLAELGMLGIPLSEDSGGADMGLLSFAVALEEIGSVCGSTARVVLSQTALCGFALEGHPAVEAIAGGERLAAFIGLEFGITASENGDAFTLSGTAAIVTAAVEADDLVVAATGAEGETLLFCVEAAAAEREAIPALGFRASGTGRITLDAVAATADQLVCRGGAATKALDKAHIAVCIGAGAMAVGMARASRKVAVAHAGERIAFGKPLARQQAVALKFADTHRAAEAARHLVYHAARLADGAADADADADAGDVRMAANMAKLAAVEAAVLSADESIQVLGGYGFTVEYHAERHYRDAKTLEVLDASAESLRNELAITATQF